MQSQQQQDMGVGKPARVGADGDVTPSEVLPHVRSERLVGTRLLGGRFHIFTFARGVSRRRVTSAEKNSSSPGIMPPIAWNSIER